MYKKAIIAGTAIALAFGAAFTYGAAWRVGALQKSHPDDKAFCQHDGSDVRKSAADIENRARSRVRFMIETSESVRLGGVMGSGE